MIANQLRKPRGVRYPWGEWFRKGKTVVLKRGRDYAGLTYGMVSTIKQAAKRFGYEIEMVDIQDGRITLKRIR